MIELIQAVGLITTFIAGAKIHSACVVISELTEIIYYQRCHIAQLNIDYYWNKSQKTQKKRRNYGNDFYR